MRHYRCLSLVVFCIALLCAEVLSAERRLLVHETFDKAHDVGHAPAWSATAYSPEEKDHTVESFLRIVGPENNDAGTGNGLVIRDYDKSQMRFTHDFTENDNYQISVLRYSFDFMYISGGKEKADLKVIGSDHGSTMNGNDRQFAVASLTSDGHFVVDGKERTGKVNVSSGTHHLDVYINDLEESFNYLAPNGFSAVLKPNTADWYIDGELVESNSLFLPKTKGTIENFGRIGLKTSRDDAGVCYVVDNIQIEDLNATPRPKKPGKSWLVYEQDGKLQYGRYANLDQDNKDQRVPDYSRCGYKGGGVPIPFVPAVVTLSPGMGDDTKRIQDAIKKVSAMPIQENGFRGAVLLKAGKYELNSTITIEGNGIVLRGEGQQKVGGTTLVFSSNQQISCIRLAVKQDYQEVSSTLTRITDNLVPTGEDTINVVDASGYKVGDRILVYNRYNNAWVKDIYDEDPIDPKKDPLENPPYDWSGKEYSLIDNPRVVKAINGNQITLDAPVVATIESKYGGGEIVKYTHGRSNKNCGIENLRIEAKYAYPLQDEMPWAAISVRNTYDFWVRQVTGQYIGKNLIDLGKGCHFGTIEDCAMIDYRGVLKGGGRYGFAIDDSNYILFQRCYARNGRHDFIVGSKCPGPNTFVDCGSEMAIADIGPHSRWAMGFLWDNVKGQRIQVPNRRDTGSGHGWAGVQQMLWNCDSTVMMCDAPTGAMNWSVGCYTAKIEGKVKASSFGIWDSHNIPVTPRSLYYAQLRDRLGWSAVQNVIIPEQASGDIWLDLFDWGGEGLFGDPVVAWSQNRLGSDKTVELRANVRYLNMLDKGIDVTWSKVSGPGRVQFSNSKSLETKVKVETVGDYIFQVRVTDGVVTAVAYTTVSPMLPMTDLPFAEVPMLRKWTSSTGSTTRAKLINVSGDSVTLMTAAGRQMIVNVEQLSDPDRHYLEQRVATRRLK